MGQLAIVNAPSIFPAIWGMMKPWLSKETADKVDILGSNYKDVLLNLIEADCLPSSLGGTCECPEYGGCHKGCSGPWMDGRRRESRRQKTSCDASTRMSIDKPRRTSLKEKLSRVTKSKSNNMVTEDPTVEVEGAFSLEEVRRVVYVFNS